MAENKFLDIENGELVLSNSKAYTDEQLATKQPNLTTAQLNAVNSGIDSSGVSQIGTNANNITEINTKIPDTASAYNQLAPKDYVDNKFNGASKALAYGDYSTMITAFNDFGSGDYNVGQNIYIRTLNVPDLWICSVEGTYSYYTYVDDATFVTELTTNGYVQVGWFRLAQLETQTASISNVTASDIDSQSATSGQILTADGNSGASWQNNDALKLDTSTQQLAGTKTITASSSTRLNLNTTSNNQAVSFYFSDAPSLTLGNDTTRGMIFQMLSASAHAPFYHNIKLRLMSGYSEPAVYFYHFPLKGGTFAVLKHIAPEFSTGISYAVGDIVYYQSGIYECNTAHQGAWNASHFTEVNLTQIFAREYGYTITVNFGSNVQVGEYYACVNGKWKTYNQSATINNCSQIILKSTTVSAGEYITSMTNCDYVPNSQDQVIIIDDNAAITIDGQAE